jgi:hypothetical protein
MADNAKKSLVTPLAILSYPHLHQPQAPQNGKGNPKYSCALVFTPEVLATEDGKARFTAIQKAALEAGKAKFGDKFDALLKSDSFKKGFRTDAESKGYPAGSIYINVRTEQQPGMVMGDLTKIPADKIKTELYAGAIVRASIVAFAFDRDGGKGIGFALNNIQKIRNGERLDNRVDASKEFEADLSQQPEDLDKLVG